MDVTEAATGDEALARAQVEGAELVLLDLMLPGIDGMEVLRRLRTFSDVPVIVLTVRDTKEDKLAALDAGADDYVTKPFDSDELLARVRAALRRSAAPRVQAQTITVRRRHDRPRSPGRDPRRRATQAHSHRVAPARAAPRVRGSSRAVRHDQPRDPGAIR